MNFTVFIKSEIVSEKPVKDYAFALDLLKPIQVS